MLVVVDGEVDVVDNDGDESDVVVDVCGDVTVIDGDIVDVSDVVGPHAASTSATPRTRMAVRRMGSPPVQRHSPSESCNREGPVSTGDGYI